MARTDGLVVARTSFFSGNKLVRAGDVWAADDPYVTHYPAAFRPLVVHSSIPERATAVAAAKPARPRSGGRFARTT